MRDSGSDQPRSVIRLISTLGPVEAGERVDAIDVLRGLALLGIFPVNVFTGFALPQAAMFIPTVAGGYGEIDRAIYWVMHVGFELKMMTLFALLFGAGVVLQTRRVEREGRSAAGLYYRRLGWLALFGLIHAYGFWFGDILFTYAVCATVVYPLRRLSPKVLFGIAGVLLAIGLVAFVGAGALMTLGTGDESGRRSMLESMGGTPELIAREIAQRTGTLSQMLRWNAVESLLMHLFLIPFFGVWRVIGVMLLGVALLKLDVLTARRSARFYSTGAVVGYVVGVPITAAGLASAEADGFGIAHAFMVWTPANYIGSLGVAFGHLCVVMLACKAGVLTLLRRGLAAVGRAAFTNYFMQTAIGLGIFTGWGLGMMNQWSRGELALLTLGVWVAQVALSLLWFSAFRIGPMEWVWRSLTYARLQPWRTRVPETTSPGV